MNITTTTKTVTEHTFILTAEDVERYKADPRAFRDDVLAQLQSDGEGNGSVKTTKHKATARLSGRGRKNGKAAKTKPTWPAKTGLLSCPHCPRKFHTQGWLNQHLAKAHPGTAAAAA